MKLTVKFISSPPNRRPDPSRPIKTYINMYRVTSSWPSASSVYQQAYIRPNIVNCLNRSPFQFENCFPPWPSSPTVWRFPITHHRPHVAQIFLCESSWTISEKRWLNSIESQRHALLHLLPSWRISYVSFDSSLLTRPMYIRCWPCSCWGLRACRSSFLRFICLWLNATIDDSPFSLWWRAVVFPPFWFPNL